MKILIDTNILIYGLDKKSAFYKKSKTVLNDNNFILYISSKNISEYFAVCTKLKLDFYIMMDFYKEIKSNCKLIMPCKDSLIIFENLIEKYKPSGNRVYDIEIVSIMLANKVNSIATANFNDFKNIQEINILNL